MIETEGIDINHNPEVGGIAGALIYKLGKLY